MARSKKPDGAARIAAWAFTPTINPVMHRKLSERIRRLIAREVKRARSECGIPTMRKKKGTL